MSKASLRVALLMVFVSGSAFATTYTVTNSADSGPGTLRQAILNANANPGADTIVFTTDVVVTASLPSITDPITIDGDRGGVRTIIQLMMFVAGSNAFAFDAGSSGSMLRNVDVRGFVNSVVVQPGVANVVVNRNALDRIQIDGNDNRVGGTSSGDGNIIDRLNVDLGNGNEFYRNQIRDAILTGSTNNRVGNVGNGNQFAGVFVNGSTGILEGNIFSPVSPLAFAHGIILINGSKATFTNNTISGYVRAIRVDITCSLDIAANSIFGNTTLGIDNGSDGPTPNDPAPDADVGGNGLQNFPVLTSAAVQGSAVRVDGTLTSAPLTNYRVELFSNAASDPEARTFLTSFNVITDVTGNTSFSSQFNALIAAGEVITSTATNVALGETSEVSAPAAVTAFAATTGDVPTLSPWALLALIAALAFIALRR